MKMHHIIAILFAIAIIGMLVQQQREISHLQSYLSQRDARSIVSNIKGRPYGGSFSELGFKPNKSSEQPSDEDTTQNDHV